jgi:hypothetical protein
VEINYKGKTVEAEMVDSCPGCGVNDLGRFSIVDALVVLGSWYAPREDMSPATFEKLAPLDVGVIEIDWHFLRR